MIGLKKMYGIKETSSDEVLELKQQVKDLKAKLHAMTSSKGAYKSRYEKVIKDKDDDAIELIKIAKKQDYTRVVDQCEIIGIKLKMSTDRVKKLWGQQ